MHGTYLGFAIDYAIEFIAGVTVCVTVIISTSLYVGHCVYTNAMVADMRAQVHEINKHLLSARQADRHNRTNNVRSVIENIRFHHTIIG